MLTNLSSERPAPSWAFCCARRGRRSARDPRRTGRRRLQRRAPARPRGVAVAGPRWDARIHIAANASMSKQAIKPLLDHLEQRGYLKRVPDPHDHRAQRIHTTPRGQRLMATASAIITEIDQDIEANSGPAPTPSCARSSKTSRRSPRTPHDPLTDRAARNQRGGAASPGNRRHDRAASTCSSAPTSTQRSRCPQSIRSLSSGSSSCGRSSRPDSGQEANQRTPARTRLATQSGASATRRPSNARAGAAFGLTAKRAAAEARLNAAARRDGGRPTRRGRRSEGQSGGGGDGRLAA